MIRDCPYRKFGHMAPVRPAHPAPALPAPPLRRNPGPVDRRAPFPPQQYGHQQRGVGTRADHGRGQVRVMEAEASEDAAEWESQYLDQEP